MKKIAYFLLAGLVAGACQPKDEFVFKGTLSEPFTGTVYLTYLQVDKGLTKLDSVSLDHATEFQFTGKIEHPDCYRITTTPHQYSAEFIAEPQSEYQATFEDKQYDTPVNVVRGGAEQTILNEYAQSMKDFKAQEKALQEAYEAATQGRKGPNAQADSIMKEMGDAFQAREDATRTFILEHAKNYVACQLAGGLLLYTFPDLEAIYTSMDTTTYAYSYSFQSFKRKYQNIKSKWIQGSPAPDFTTRDLNGREVKLSDFRGQYVLLDFWASWCHPCRQRAAELKAIYDQLQARGITVCGLSMDEDKAQWAKATREDGIVWTNTGELKPFKENSIAADYKVTQLPTMFLIDPEGVVAMQNPEIEDLLKLPVKE